VRQLGHRGEQRRLDVLAGPQDVDGRAVTNDELDECHGHVGPAPDANGATTTVYHYHTTEAFPYVLGCFRGTPTVRSLGR